MNNSINISDWQRVVPAKLFTSLTWQAILYQCLDNTFMLENNLTYNESIGAVINISPVTNHVVSKNINVFDPKKAAAMYFWYKMADRKDKSIIKYFPEYKRCIDKKHTRFNSNYGYYANNGLKLCIDILSKNKNSRQACFMINNNLAMSDKSIDKLCTNAIMFFIRDEHLHMVVQMRSSNALTLLPYDAFIFCVWYAKVFNALSLVYPALTTRSITLQIASLHFYEKDALEKQENIESNNLDRIFDYKDIRDHNFENILENKLIKFLKS